MKISLLDDAKIKIIIDKIYFIYISRIFMVIKFHTGEILLQLHPKNPKHSF